MKYVELIEGIKNFEDSFWFGEYVYFKALEKLEGVRANLSMLETKHVKEIIKMFLIQWGRMGRTVERIWTGSNLLSNCVARKNFSRS